MTELVFKGKEFVYNHHLAVPFRPLEMHADKSIGEPRLDGDLIIQGDNLHALKALLPMYAGKVDCIFIDPPYNTGNEGWSYNDNVNSPVIKEWLSGNPIGSEDKLRHDKWCAMMFPRLKLLYELLSDGGSFWITLDDNEIHRVRCLMDEIFGEEKFHANVVWRSSDNSNNDAIGFSVDKNHLLVYGKNANWSPQKLDSPEKRGHFKNPNNDPNGPWFDGNPVDSPNYRENLIYNITTKSGKLIHPPRNGWRWNREEMRRRMEIGEIRISEDETRIIRRTYLKDMKRLPPSDLWIDLGKYGHNRNAKYELQNMFSGISPFETPKPKKLLEAILQIAIDDNAIVLDSFAGSGTTAHAVLAQNAKDGGNRKFILVECEDYADSLTAERVRRVINGYEFEGTQREELLREKVTWTTFSKDKKRTQLLDKIKAIEESEGERFDKIKREIKDGELIVTGEKQVTERTDGLGGSFTYCTLGKALELDKLLTGEELPDFKALGAVLFHMATNRPFDARAMQLGKDGVGQLGVSGATRVWLIYKPDVEWLKSAEAALTLTRAREMAENDPDSHHLVFAPARFVSQRMLNEQKLKVEFAPLPYALYRIERG